MSTSFTDNSTVTPAVQTQLHWTSPAPILHISWPSNSTMATIYYGFIRCAPSSLARTTCGMSMTPTLSLRQNPRNSLGCVQITHLWALFLLLSLHPPFSCHRLQVLCWGMVHDWRVLLSEIACQLCLLQDQVEQSQMWFTLHFWVLWEAKSLSDSLVAIGEPVPDNELVQTILRGLNAEYDQLVTPDWATT